MPFQFHHVERCRTTHDIPFYRIQLLLPVTFSTVPDVTDSQLQFKSHVNIAIETLTHVPSRYEINDRIQFSLLRTC